MRFAFVHVPKTGGLYVKRVLQAIGVVPVYLGSAVHGTLEGIINVPEVGTYYSFACVRHPADWLASLWAHRERRDGAVLSPWLNTMLPHNADWATFVDETVDLRPGIVSTLMTQLTAGVDIIGRTPSVKADLSKALQNAGIDYDTVAFNSVDPVNVGNNKPDVTGAQLSKIEQAEQAILSTLAGEDIEEAEELGDLEPE